MKNRDLFLEEGQLEDICDSVLGKDLVEIGKQWFGSIFKPLRVSSIRNIGSFGQQYVALVMSHLGKDVIIPSEYKKGHDLIIDGKRVEIKTSMLSIKGNNNFMQIRPFSDMQYIIICCIDTNGVVSLFKLTRKKMDRGIKNGFIVEQHKNGTGKSTELYRLSDNIDNLINVIGLKEIDIDGVVSEKETRDIIDKLMHNHNINNGHMEGTFVEPFMYSPAKIGHLTRSINKAMFENFDISAEILNMDSKINKINGGKDKIMCRGSRISIDGTYRINQIRLAVDFDYMFLTCYKENDDFDVYQCRKCDLVEAKENGSVGNQHNNHKGTGETGLDAIAGTIEQLKEKLNLVKV